MFVAVSQSKTQQKYKKEKTQNSKKQQGPENWNGVYQVDLDVQVSYRDWKV